MKKQVKSTSALKSSKKVIAGVKANALKEVMVNEEVLVSKKTKKEIIPFIADEVKASEEEEKEILAMPVEKFEVLAKFKRSEKKEKVAKESKGPGVILTIASLIEVSGEKGISKGAILESLIKTFPERDPECLKATINTQLGGRISKEKFPIEKIEGGFYRKVNIAA